nr:pseudouridine synthase [Rhizobium sp. Q54]
MTPKDKPKRGGSKSFERSTKPKPSAKGAGGKSGFSAKAGLKPKAGKEKVEAHAVEAAAKPERISKILARAGVASRRDVERMIMEGRVRLNGQVLETPVVNATLEDRIEVDGEPIRGIERTRLWLYHKPAGLVTTNADPEGRPTVFDNLPDGLPRVMSIGRLDINTEGLLLLTNDGGLARVLELPTTGWLRRYRVRAHGEVDQAALDKLKEGIAVDGVLYGAIDATLDRKQGHNVWITVGLREGKNREVKNVLGALGLEVNRLIRISYGPFQLGDLPEGQVVEVRGRMLREQLGPRLIEEAKANFDAPIYSEPAGADGAEAAPAPAERPESGGWTKQGRSEQRDGKPAKRPEPRGEGRGFAGKNAPRGGSRDDSGFGAEKPKKRPPMGTSRTANVWMAPGARPTTDSKAKKSSARAEAERLFDKPSPQSERRVVVKRADEDSDWIRAETPPPGREERGRDFGRKSAFGARSEGGNRASGGDRPFDDRPARGDRPFAEKPRGARTEADRARGPRTDKSAGDRSFGDKPRGKPFGGKPAAGKPGGGSAFGGRPGGKPGGGGRGKPGGGGGRPGGRPAGGKPRTRG